MPCALSPDDADQFVREVMTRPQLTGDAELTLDTKLASLFRDDVDTMTLHIWYLMIRRAFRDEKGCDSDTVNAGAIDDAEDVQAIADVIKDHLGISAEGVVSALIAPGIAREMLAGAIPRNGAAIESAKAAAVAAQAAAESAKAAAASAQAAAESAKAAAAVAKAAASAPASPASKTSGKAKPVSKTTPKRPRRKRK